MAELLRYQCEDGSEPFTEWLAGVRDKVAQARIRLRLRQAEAGNLGDVCCVGDGVFELRRIHIAYRRRLQGLFRTPGTAIVILLCGGDKRHQVAASGAPSIIGWTGKRGKHEQIKERRFAP